MYIIKNALRCISRAKGRNILIGIITLVIAVSACLGLSIQQAAESAKENALGGMRITATISYDRSSVMGQLGGGFSGGGFPSGGFDKDQFADIMGSSSSLTLEDYQKYAVAESVGDFYYTLTSYFNGSETLSPVTDESSEDDSSSSSSTPGFDFPGGMGGMMGGGKFSMGDFTVVGYSSYNAMSAFISGTASILEGGSVFDAESTALECVISEELAIYNSLNVGDTITVTNSSVEDETFTLTVCGIYTSTANNNFSNAMFGAGMDPANQIYMSAPALQALVDTATEDSMRTTLDATYVFTDPEHYYAFEEEVRALGLSESYTVSSADISSFENSLSPLTTLSTIAGGFLLVILLIGAVILVVLNIFNVRERKYEVGVLTAMGMNKQKVALQFICEILVVTMLAVIIGAGVGAVCSVPVTNALLENQIASQSEQQTQIDNSFGRPGVSNGMPGGMPGGTPSGMPGNMGGGDPFGDMFGGMFGGAANYISQVDSAMNLTVVLQMIGIGLILTLIASAASVLFIMRYDPLKILANRD